MKEKFAAFTTQSTNPRAGRPDPSPVKEAHRRSRQARYLILGASSAMARALADALARQGTDLYLGARDLDDVKRTAADLQIRHGVVARAGFFDALDTDSHQSFAEAVINEMGGLTGVILAFGTMVDQEEAIDDFQKAETMIASNFTGAVSILTHLANYFEEQKSGVIVGISSVAGDRGRQSNYVYGASKAALTVFLQGLRNRLYHCGVQVMTVKPGFVDTAMTYGLKLPPIVASPEVVANDIVRAIRNRADVIYTPFFWRYIMFLICSMPEFLFKRLKL